jgi:hypothetical protein
MSLKKKIVYVIIGLLVIIQFFRIDKKNPAVNPDVDFVVLSSAPEDMRDLLRTSCYDCHSNEIVYPWYSNVAPISWWIKDHINDGRGHLNFSVWGEYNEKRKDHKLEEIIDEVGEHEMPLKSYLIIHTESKLDDTKREELINWIQSLRTSSGTSN